METVAALFGDYWGFVIVVLGAYAWLIRLESRAVNNTKKIEKLEVKRAKDLEDLERRLNTQRNEDIQARRDRDSSQERTFKEIHDDIKLLLQRTSPNELKK